MAMPNVSQGLTEEVRDVMKRYREAFGEAFPMWYTAGRLDAINKGRAAIRRGEPIDINRTAPNEGDA